MRAEGGRRPGERTGLQQGGVDADGPQWPVALMLIGLFGIIILFHTIGQRTLVSFTEFFRWFALFAFGGNLLPKRWYAAALRMDRLEWLWFNLLAVGPLLTGACLVVNFSFHGPVQHMLVQQGSTFDLHAYWLEHRALPPHLPWPADLGEDPAKDRRAMATARQGDEVYGLAEGALGYIVIVSRGEVPVLPQPGRVPGN